MAWILTNLILMGAELLCGLYFGSNIRKVNLRSIYFLNHFLSDEYKIKTEKSLTIQKNSWKSVYSLNRGTLCALHVKNLSQPNGSSSFEGSHDLSFNSFS